MRATLLIDDQELCTANLASPSERPPGDSFKAVMSDIPDEAAAKLLSGKVPGDRIVRRSDGRRYLMSSIVSTETGGVHWFKCTLTELPDDE